MGRYEALRGSAENERKPKLTDTMEIIVPPTNYNMPPIDNKVTKINRRKSNIVTRYVDNLRIRRKKEMLVRKKQVRESENDYMNSMRLMMKKKKTPAPKPAEQKTAVGHIIKQPQKRSEQKNHKPGQGCRSLQLTK